MNKRVIIFLLTGIIVAAFAMVYVGRQDTPPKTPMPVIAEKPKIPEKEKTPPPPEVANLKIPENDAPPPDSRYTPVMPIRYKVSAYKEIPVPNADALEPRVSPDGRQVVFVKKTGDKTILAIANLSDNTVIPIDAGLDGYSHPSWSPNGKKIVFSAVKAGAWEIFAYDISGKQLTQFTNDPARKKTYPKYSPYPFDKHFRIAYASEENGRKDIWWIRENGEDERPITMAAEKVNEYMNPDRWKGYVGVPNLIVSDGDFPEWSPNGNLMIRKTQAGYGALGYGSDYWWKAQPLPLPNTTGILLWSPNQNSFLEYLPSENAAYQIWQDSSGKKKILADKHLTSSPAFFPDGKGLAYTYKKDGRSILAIEPFDDPLGDVANLWMYPYQQSQREKIAQNQLLFLHADYDLIYKIYETEFYHCSGPYEFEHARPYLVTSDAVLEAFYTAFAALLNYTENAEFVNSLTEFASAGYETARTKNASDDVKNFFLTGLVLIRPDAAKDLPPQVSTELERINKASDFVESLIFGQKIAYSDFLIRGKYENQPDLHPYFKSLKWFQTFVFDLEKEVERRQVSEIMEVVNAPQVYAPIEKINRVLKSFIGESRYFGPLTSKAIPQIGLPTPPVPELPWVRIENSFKLFPSIYSMDTFVFDKLLTHPKDPDTVGTIENARLLPVGLDIMAAFGSDEAKKILLGELNQGQFGNYEKKLDEVGKKIAGFSDNAWTGDVYHSWLGMLKTLVRNPPANTPEFARSKSWKRKELSTALGSWTNLRYGTVAYIEEGGAECGEGGYEQLNIGFPRGYVEPNPEFFDKLDQGFGKIQDRFREIIKDPALGEAVSERLNKFREHLKTLGNIARKELDNVPLTDAEYDEILYIGRTVEHFIIIINSMDSNKNHSIGVLRNPDPVSKIVQVMKTPDKADTLYEALGPVNEINVIVPYFGRRQIVKGPVYSYYEFVSSQVWNNDKWRKEYEKAGGLPIWIRDYYDGKRTDELQGR